MDRLLTAPGRGLADADAPLSGYHEAAPTPPRNPADRTADAFGADPFRADPFRADSFGADSFDADPFGADQFRASVEPRRSVSRARTSTKPRLSTPRRPPGRQSTEQLPYRRLFFGILVGALTMLGVASVDSLGGPTVPVLGSFAALPAAPSEPEVVEVPPPPATPGTCLTWSRPDAADTTMVDCAQPHLFEQAGTVQLSDQATLPDDQSMRQLVNERCTPVVLNYLGGKFDPVGRYRVGALKPSPAAWEQGDRELRCGLQSASRSGALYPLSGKAAESDQSAVQEPGTCLAIDGRTIGDPVSCDGQHAVETVGIVDLSARFPDVFPQVADQDGFLQPECLRIAGEYAGGPDVITAKGLTVYWDNVTEASWAAGTRKVNCNLAALLPDRSGFAPVTGPVKGTVVVGGQPAPPAANLPVAGVPAPTVAPTVTDPAAAPPPADPAAPAPAEGEQPPAAEETAADPAEEAAGEEESADSPEVTPAPTTVPPVVVDTSTPEVDVDVSGG